MNEKELFENGCFLPCWAEDDLQETMPIQQVYAARNKDLDTLYAELADIKQHIQDVQERQWILAKLIQAPIYKHKLLRAYKKEGYVNRSDLTTANHAINNVLWLFVCLNLCTF